MDHFKPPRIQLLRFPCVLLVFVLADQASASDWLRFRGPNGSGVSADTAPLPTEWSPTQNLKWKAMLPGPGSSSPIVVGDKVFVTCWSGYSSNQNDRNGELKNLKRHLVCIHRNTGDVIWDKSVAAVQPEESHGGMFVEHGYATHTPVSDGERVYVFFGKTGAIAFDLDGNQLWQTLVGKGSDRMGRGSASSPILCKDLLIVTAAAEGEAMCGLDKLTGKELWRSEAEGYQATWGTPILVEIDETRTDIVIAVPFEIWAIDPASGKLSWFCDALSSRNFCSSAIVDNKTVYAVGEQGSGSIAVTAGGKDDVTKTNIIWKGRDNGRVSTPLIADGRLYSINSGVLTCLDAKSNTKLYQSRLTSGGATAEGADEGFSRGRTGGVGDRAQGGPRGPGGFGRGGGMGSQDYSSPVAGDGKLYFVTRSGDCHVVKLGESFEKLATNRVNDESEDFSATPAISDGDLFIRSSKHLYCISERK